MKLCRDCHRVFADDAAACDQHGPRLYPEPLIGAVLGGYRVDGWLGEGGMGILYHAEHTAIGRRAAVKVIRRELGADETAAARFEQEARAVAQIGHPNLIDIFDIGRTPDGRLYYVMELLEGRSLAAAMEERRLPFQEFAPLVLQALGALEAAHAVGVVHRDLKPDNLFLVERPGEPPTVKLLDFGVAKVIGDGGTGGGRLTQAGGIVGTPQYMAPEQIDGTSVDRRADVYALGVILYQLATGRLPFQADTLGGMLRAHLMDAPPAFDVGALAPGVPPALEAVAFHAMARAPEQRYPSVAALAEDLRRVLAGEEPAATAWWRAQRLAPPTLAGGVPPGGPLPLPAGAEELAPRRYTGHWVVFALLALVDVAVAGVAGVRHGQPTPLARPAPAPAPVVVAPPPPRRPAGPDLVALRRRAIEVLTAATSDGDPAIRREAAEALAGGHEPPHHALIGPLLDDGDPGVRAAAAHSLGMLGAPPAVPRLEAALGREPLLDSAAGEALLRLRAEGARQRVGELLRRRLRERGLSTATLTRLAVVLLELDDAEARRRLEARTARLQPGDAEGLRALAALARRGSGRARQALVQALARGDDEAQLMAAGELAGIGSTEGQARLVRFAADEASPLRLKASRQLAALDDQSGYDLFAQAVGERARPAEERALAAEGLGASGEKAALAALSPLLADGDARLRVAAAGAVLAIVAADPATLAARSLEWARAALASASPEVRQEAVAVLADADPAQAVPLLGRALDDARPEVRRAAARSLGRTRSPEAVPLLDKALADARPDVRREALGSIEHIADAGAVTTVLARFFGRADAEEKVIAAGELVELGDRSHLATLKDALRSTTAELRRLALEKTEALLRAAPEVGKDAMMAGLKDRSFPVRFEAATQLARRGQREGAGVLQEAVARGGADSIKAYVALQKLGIKPQRALQPGALLDAPEVGARVVAVREAAALSPLEGLAFLRRAVRDPALPVRLAAVEAAGDYSAASARSLEPGLRLLRSATHDADPAVRARAASLLSRLAPPATSEPAPADDSVGEPAAPRAAEAVDLGPGAPDLGPGRAVDRGPPAAADLGPAPLVAAAPAPAPVAPPVEVAGPTPGVVVQPLRPVPPPISPGAIEAGRREEANLAQASGELSLKTGNYKNAIAELNRAHRLNPRLAIFFSLGEAYRKMGDREIDPARQRESYRQAIASYRKAKGPNASAYAAELEQRLREGN